MTSYFKGTDSGVNPIHRGINDPKRPFRITIIRYVELETFTAHGVLFVLLVIHGGEPYNSGRFLIEDALDCND